MPLLTWSQLTGRGIILPGSVLAKDSFLAKDPPQGSLHLMTGLLGGIGSSMLAPFHDNSERSSELQNSPVVIFVEVTLHCDFFLSFPTCPSS